MREDWSNVSKDKLAALFPIILKEHDPEWNVYYLQERDFLQSVFGNQIIRISHIGSSAVSGMIAKPTVDILVEAAKDTEIQFITEKMLDEGYVVNTPENDMIMYIKGYTPRGFEGQAVHVHVRDSGDWGELYFRDFLMSHPETAREYEALKIKLKEQYMYDRDGYTAAKGQFIKRYTEQARIEFANRYTP